MTERQTDRETQHTSKRKLLHAQHINCSIHYRASDATDRRH